jgi:hypothetical protein
VAAAATSSRQKCVCTNVRQVSKLGTPSMQSRSEGRSAATGITLHLLTDHCDHLPLLLHGSMQHSMLQLNSHTNTRLRLLQTNCGYSTPHSVSRSV